MPGVPEIRLERKRILSPTVRLSGESASKGSTPHGGNRSISGDKEVDLVSSPLKKGDSGGFAALVFFSVFSEPALSKAEGPSVLKAVLWAPKNLRSSTRASASSSVAVTMMRGLLDSRHRPDRKRAFEAPQSSLTSVAFRPARISLMAGRRMSCRVFMGKTL